MVEKKRILSNPFLSLKVSPPEAKNELPVSLRFCKSIDTVPRTLTIISKIFMFIFQLKMKLDNKRRQG